MFIATGVYRKEIVTSLQHRRRNQFREMAKGAVIITPQKTVQITRVLSLPVLSPVDLVAAPRGTLNLVPET
jgi:hypothetical protein